MRMPVRRKVFRIEQMHPIATAGAITAGEAVSAPHSREIVAELKALRDLIERQTGGAHGPDAGTGEPSGLRQLRDNTDIIHRALCRTKAEVATLYAGTFSAAGRSRATRELDAVVDGTESATRRILAAAEIIEEAANTLSASLKREQEQALAQDIRDQATRIFEACNFQDLSGQRIAKVLATLQFVEGHVARMMQIWDDIAAAGDHAAAASAHATKTQALHGPPLDGDSGHASQAEVDKLFAHG